MTLLQRLFLLVTIALLPAIAIQAYNEFDLRRSREQEVRDLALRQAELAASEIEQIFTGVENLLTAVAEVPAVQALDRETCVAYLASLQPRVPHLLSIGVIARDGQVACRQTTPSTPLRAGDRPYFKETLRTEAFVVGEYTEGRVTGRPVLPLAVPLRRPGAPVMAVLVAALDLDWLAKQLEQRGLAEGGSITVADRNGIILARTPLPERFIGTRIPDPFQHLVHERRPGAVRVVSQDGTPRVLGYLPVTPGRQFYVSAGLSSEQSFAAITRATVRGFTLIAAGVILSFGAAWIVGNRFFRRPIGMLLSAADRWRAGDYASRTGLAGERSEFGALGQAFDQMMGEVAERQAERDRINQALRASEDRLRQFNAELEQRVAAMLAERARQEEALRHSQKMQAVGQLAGGVAHDFNNLLTAILGHLRHLRQRAPAELMPATEGIELAVRRGERLARQLLTFSRHAPVQAEVVDLQQALSEMQGLLEKSLPPSTVLLIDIEPGPFPVQVDVADLELALLNLLANARDAMPGGGTIRLSVARAQRGPDSTTERVSLSICDTGLGMTPEVQARAFEPFFTTKDVGKGTGLGLSSVYGFARQSGGEVELDSTPGDGTTVRLLLPLAPLSSNAGASGDRPLVTTAAVAPFRSRPLRVLVVEDDPLVRTVTEEALADAGFEVLGADSAEVALAALERESGTLDAVVSDVVMPGPGNGIDIARQIGRRWPQLALVLTTGYTADGLALDEMPEHFVLLTKPFSVDELVLRLRALVERAAAPAA
jgi:signal transduction histidine kinase/ActR/RegA family two-component response regulator